MDIRQCVIYSSNNSLRLVVLSAVAEIRTMSKPPAAVEIVMEAVTALLTGKTVPFSETRKLLSGGEA